MSDITLRELLKEDEKIFLTAMLRSQSLHHPWVYPPLTSQDFAIFFNKSQKENNKCFLAFNEKNDLLGVFNVSEIILGVFNNAFLGFYSVIDYAAQGYMSSALKLVLRKCFKEFNLHRLQVGIQPTNKRSIQLVKNNGFRYEGFSPRYLKINNVWCGHEQWAMTLEDYIKDDPEMVKKDYIHLTAYNEDWPKQAQDEIMKLKNQLNTKTIIDIQHIGSTAIPGLAAKPIIDILIIVKSLDDINHYVIAELQKLDYEYWTDNPDVTKLFFVKGMPPFGNKRTHHIHIVDQNSEHSQHRLAFRDYLRNHKELAKQYESLKYKLAEMHHFDREKYTQAKHDFIQDVLKLTLSK